MSRERLENINVLALEPLPTPAQVKLMLPASELAMSTVLDGRRSIGGILQRLDHRLFVIVGPCSIHDIDAAQDYALRLKELAREVRDTLYLVMRVYFEKPRTTVGWKGLINDPDMDDSFRIERGLSKARGLLLYLAETGVPAATEALDPITPQYLSDLVSWSAIGARTTESQTHREMASGLSMPVGFKNGTDGSLSVAINALRSVSRPHHFLGIDQDGRCAVFRTKGNPQGHVVLRGGNGQPNYDPESIARCESELRGAGLPVNIVVDCSHANSGKDPERQPLVVRECVRQILAGNRSIIGLMLESNIHAGRQEIPQELGRLRYGVSVTDACIGWSTTEALIREMHGALRHVLPSR